MKINVKVTINAKNNEIIKISDNNFKIKVTCAPEKGKANKKVIELLSDYLKLPKSKITLFSGQTNSRKIFEIMD